MPVEVVIFRFLSFYDRSYFFGTYFNHICLDNRRPFHRKSTDAQTNANCNSTRRYALKTFVDNRRIAADTGELFWKTTKKGKQINITLFTCSPVPTLFLTVNGFVRDWKIVAANKTRSSRSSGKHVSNQLLTGVWRRTRLRLRLTSFLAAESKTCSVFLKKKTSRSVDVCNPCNEFVAAISYANCV